MFQWRAQFSLFFCHLINHCLSVWASNNNECVETNSYLALSFIYGFIFFELMICFRLKEDKKSWSAQAFFVHHIYSILFRLFDLTIGVWVCVCVIFAEFMAIGIRLHANYISLFCHSSPFSGWNVHEFHMFNCYQAPKKEPENTCCCSRVGLDTTMMRMMGKNKSAEQQ